MRISKHPYNLLLWTIIPLIVDYFHQINTAFDIHLHDTYIVIDPLSIYATIFVFLILLWVVYRITESAHLLKKLVWLHVILTIVPLLLLVIYQYCGGLVPDYSQYPVTFESFYNYSSAFTIIILMIALFLAGQLIFLTNLTFAIIRYLKAR